MAGNAKAPRDSYCLIQEPELCSSFCVSIHPAAQVRCGLAHAPSDQSIPTVAKEPQRQDSLGCHTDLTEHITER